MEILVINPIIRKNNKPRHIPHGLAILSNLIREKIKINPKFLDINAYRYNDRKVENIIDETKPDVVLIGGIISVFGDVLKISKYIKGTYPESIIICGGSVASSIPNTLLNNSDIDIACIGEGEKTIIELLQNIKRRDIDGIAYKDKKVIINKPRDLIGNLDKESALPAYDLLPMEIYLNNHAVGLGREIDFISSRGCPYLCTFCYQPWGKKPRLHSVEFILNAIKKLKEEYDIDFVAFQDDEFLISKKRVRKFCDKLREFDKDLKWSCTGRANIMANNEDLLKKMRNNGCVLISYGFESGSQEILNSMNKRQTLNQMRKVTKLNRKYDMPIPVSYILGMPRETKKTAKETLDFSIETKTTLDSLMLATPYPGTEIYEFAKNTGRITDEFEFVKKLKDARDFSVNLTNEFTDKELVEYRKDMMRISKEEYNNYISMDEIIEKMKNLYGKLYEKSELSDFDIKYKFEHGGLCVF